MTQKTPKSLRDFPEDVQKTVNKILADFAKRKAKAVTTKEPKEAKK